MQYTAVVPDSCVITTIIEEEKNCYIIIPRALRRYRDSIQRHAVGTQNTQGFLPISNYVANASGSI
jgi:hypothetical protein